MPYILIEHTVEAYESWKPYFDDHAETRAESGSLGGQLFHIEGDPEQVVILFEWETAEQAHEFVESEDLHERMDAAGVVGEPRIQFLEQLEDFET